MWIKLCRHTLKNGTYQETPPLPFVLGMEVSGVVDALGSNVTNFSIGDELLFLVDKGAWLSMDVRFIKMC